MDNFYRLIGWKTSTGRFDKKEIQTDLIVLTIGIFVIIGIFYVTLQ